MVFGGLLDQFAIWLSGVSYRDKLLGVYSFRYAHTDTNIIRHVAVQTYHDITNSLC